MLIPVNFLKGISIPQVFPNFEFTINTTLVGTGSSAANQFTLPLIDIGTYNMTVKWGDGTSNIITVWNQPEKTHTYPTPGVYNVSITGTCNGWRHTNSGTDRLKTISIQNWGNGFTLTPGISGINGPFYNNINLISITAPDVPILTTSMYQAFARCNNLETFNNIGNWDISGVTNLGRLFIQCFKFNENINNWDTSNVTDMSQVFASAYLFNQPLNNWNTSNVTTMFGMFASAYVFNQDITMWDTSNVIFMTSMFNSALAFNQPIGNWDVSNVVTMTQMFSKSISLGPSSFNQPLNFWNTSNVMYMDNMFNNATAFNQSLNNWDVSLVTNMNGMFNGTVAFNQPLNLWNTGNVTKMQYMFANAQSFNSSVAGWNLSSLININDMFNNTLLFNQPINTWINYNVSNKITNTSYMFAGAAVFNQPLPDYFLDYVENMAYMFSDAPLFNQSLSNQRPGAYTDFCYIDAINFIEYTSVTPENLSNLYNAWYLNYNAASTGCPYSDFSTDVQYTAAGAASRQSLIDDYGWTIVDGGLV